MDNWILWFSAVVAALTLIASWLTEQQKKSVNKSIGMFFRKLLGGFLFPVIRIAFLCAYWSFPIAVMIFLIRSREIPSWEEIIMLILLLNAYRIELGEVFSSDDEKITHKQYEELEKRLATLEKLLAEQQSHQKTND